MLKQLLLIATALTFTLPYSQAEELHDGDMPELIAVMRMDPSTTAERCQNSYNDAVDQFAATLKGQSTKPKDRCNSERAVFDARYSGHEHGTDRLYTAHEAERTYSAVRVLATCIGRVSSVRIAAYRVYEALLGAPCRREPGSASPASGTTAGDAH